jgi:hypothetical protein
MARSFKVGIVNDRPIVGCDFLLFFVGSGSALDAMVLAQDTLGCRAACLLHIWSELKCNRRFLFGELQIVIGCDCLLC